MDSESTPIDMLLSLLKSKLHMARVTRTELTYHGSITIDPDLMEAVGLVSHERVLVSNCSTGQRGETYVIRGRAGDREVQLNGAMARLAQPGDRVIVMAFAQMSPEEASRHQPVVAILDDGNRVVETIGR
jgi:aspartate 1-decarboxylase